MNLVAIIILVAVILAALIFVAIILMAISQKFRIGIHECLWIVPSRSLGACEASI